MEKTTKKSSATKVRIKKTQKKQPVFCIKPEEQTMIKNSFPTILDALREAKKICNSTKKSVYVYKKQKNELIDMAVVNFFYTDFFANIDKKKNTEEVEEDVANEKKHIRKVCEDGELPILEKDWDKL